MWPSPDFAPQILGLGSAMFVMGVAWAQRRRRTAYGPDIARESLSSRSSGPRRRYIGRSARAALWLVVAIPRRNCLYPVVVRPAGGARASASRATKLHDIVQSRGIS